MNAAKPIKFIQAKMLSVKAIDDYCLEVVILKGEELICGVFDVKPYVQGESSSEFFKELSDENYFKSVMPLRYGVTWPNEQDFSIDTILYHLKNIGSISEK